MPINEELQKVTKQLEEKQGEVDSKRKAMKWKAQELKQSVSNLLTLTEEEKQLRTIKEFRALLTNYQEENKDILEALKNLKHNHRELYAEMSEDEFVKTVQEKFPGVPEDILRSFAKEQKLKLSQERADKDSIAPTIIKTHQSVIKNKWSEEENREWKNLREVCDTFMKDRNKVCFLEDTYGDQLVFFPELWLAQRIEYLRGWNMKAGDYELGKNHYKKYPAKDAFSGMPGGEGKNLIYKNTVDELPKEFKELLEEDMYNRGYTWKTKWQQDKIMNYLADELWLSYDPDTTNNQSVVGAYMYITWAVTWEWLNTDRRTRKDGDKYGQIDKNPISARAALLCGVRVQSFSRSEDGADYCAIPLLKGIV